MSARRPIFALSALVLACSSGETHRFVPSPGEDGTIEFIVHLRQGRVLRIWNPADLAAGPAELQPQDLDVVAHVCVSRSALTDLDPLFAPDDLDRIELAQRPPCTDCGRACIDPDTNSISSALPSGTRIVELRDEVFTPAQPGLRDSLFAEFRLELGQGQSTCAGGTPHRFVPFGAEEAELVGNIQGMRAVDEDRLLLAATDPYMLMLAMRGRDPTDNLKRAVTENDLPHDTIGGFDIRSKTSTSVRVLMISRNLPDNPVHESSVHEIEISEGGFRVLRTLATVSGTLIALATTSEGGYIAAGQQGLVVASRDGESLMEYSLGNQFRFISARAYPDELGGHFIGGALGLVVEGDAFAGPSGMVLGGLERSGGLVDSSVVGFNLRPTPGDPEVWAVTPGQGIYRRRRLDDWEAIYVDAPIGVRACTQIADQCGRAALSEDMEGLEFDTAGTMFYANAACSTIFTRAVADTCTGYASIDGLPAIESPGLTALGHFEGHTFLAKGTRVYELELE